MPARTALVTGASSGIGEATTHRLVDEGWRVLAGVRRDEDADRLRLGASRNGELVPVRCDVTDSAQVDAAVASAGGRLDAVVVNAGIGEGGPVEAVTDEAWTSILDVNVTGAARTIRASLPELRRARGRVVLIGSISGRVAAAGFAPYAASKHALAAIAEALRLEVADDGIAVTLVEPGAVKTPIWDKAEDAADRVVGELSDEQRSRLGPMIERQRGMIAASRSSAVAPGEVVDVIVEALTADRPRHRVAVGRQAKVLAVALRVLPDRARHALLARA